MIALSNHDSSIAPGFSVVDGRIMDPNGRIIPDQPYNVLPLKARAFNVLGREARRIKDPSHVSLMISDLLCLSQEELRCYCRKEDLN